MFRLSTDEYDYIRTAVVAPLGKLGARVYCFGSRARGDNQTFSDLDLMVETDQDIAAVLADLREKLTESDFPYKVDLVDFRHYAEAYKARYLRDRVLFCPLMDSKSS